MSNEFALIDLQPWFNGGATAKSAVVDAVRGACEGIGFFLIAGHGIDERLIARMSVTSRAFFDLPEVERRLVPPTGPLRGGLMYFGCRSERLAATQGEATPGDPKESLDFGPGFGGAPWPAVPQGLQAVWRDYYVAMEELCRALRAILARAAGLPGDHFEPFFGDHLSSIRVINYPEPDGAPEPGQLRAGAHTDYGFLTVLRSEDKPGGLEVMNLAGRWVAPPALPGTFVVNLADSLMRWTGGLWHSTPHRVVNPPAGSGPSRRQSIAFFHNPARDALIDTLPTFRRAGLVSPYRPITYGDYALERQQRSHGEHISTVG